MLKLALIQMTSSNDLKSNLAKMEGFVQKAAESGAQIVVFPEMAYFMGRAREIAPILSKTSELIEKFSGWAKKYDVELLPGTLREPVHGKAPRFYNTLFYFDRRGHQVAQYRKLYLFKAELSDRPYDETRYCEPGDSAKAVDCPWGKAGLAICFDLRFPELFRLLRQKDAEIVFLPSAFTLSTGQAHWEPLLRARAIENQFFVVAPGLTGTCGDGRKTFGHSMVISPWGTVLLKMAQDEDMQVIGLDLDEIRQCQSQLNPWECRRKELLPF